MVEKRGFLQRFFSRQPQLADSPDKEKLVSRVIVHDTPIGSSGTSVWSGYFDEEYLTELQGNDAADVYDKMRRQDARIRMVLNAVKNPIKGAVWEVEPGEKENAEFQRHADFIKKIVLSGGLGRPWKQKLGEILTFIDFGHSVFEVVHKNYVGDSDFGSYTGIASLGFRSQKTIETWNLDKDTGALASITQWAQGDLEPKRGKGRVGVEIPGEFLIVFTLDQEGDNYEGISGLRACYGPWFRKNQFQKLNAVGIEKTAVPTAIGTVPASLQAGDQQFSNFKANLQKYTSHQLNYMTVPEGWKIEFNQCKYDGSGTRASIQDENAEIVAAFLANFLMLGQSSGGGGSYALSFDLSDFFLSGIEHIASHVCEVLNERLVKQLIDLNFGPQKKYPMLKASGISDKAGAELATALRELATGKYITPDDPTEAHLRKRYGLPEADPNTARKSEPPVTPGQEDEEDPEDAPQPDPKAQKKKLSEPITLADKNPTKIMAATQDAAHDLMVSELSDIGHDLVKRLMKAWNSRSEGAEINAFRDVAPKGLNTYGAALEEILTAGAWDSYKQAKALAKAKTLDESTMFSAFEKLPKRTQKRIRAQSDLLVQTQGADLQKAVFFQFTASVDASMGSEDILQKDLEGAVEKYVGSVSVIAAAGNAAAMIVNEARNAVFFDDEVLEGIESFTFTNGDPVSEICKDLDGKTFEATDAEAERYFPPLHHNCKSFLVPNFVGGKNPKVSAGGLKPSSPDLEAHITLAEKRKGK